ncbi:hypothetical protein VTN00DRAFT_3429 [Thermoascus crustaceus]|uniref:uncharacterized protein n=1 Tax=Thermoascus crustaceus TaxID=5088 RepID=UPI003743A73A
MGGSNREMHASTDGADGEGETERESEGCCGRERAGLNASEQRELAARMERKQMKEFMTMYSRLVQRCFDDCVNDFTTKSLVAREEGCVMRCVDKYLKSSARLGERFQEQNAAMMQSGQLPGR